MLYALRLNSFFALSLFFENDILQKSRRAMSNRLTRLDLLNRYHSDTSKWYEVFYLGVFLRTSVFKYLFFKSLKVYPPKISIEGAPKINVFGTQKSLGTK